MSETFLGNIKGESTKNEYVTEGYREFMVNSEGWFTMYLDDFMLEGITQNKYLRETIAFPEGFTSDNYSISVILTGASGSVTDTSQIYIRNKNNKGFQVSTVGSYQDGDTVTVDITATGIIEKG